MEKKDRTPLFEMEIHHASEIELVAKQLFEACKNRKIFAFFGELGAGKTTLTNALCHILEVEDLVTSPTFSIVNEYHSPNGAVFHFDFYRIKSEEEAMDIGIEEYFDGDAYCFIEWPEKIEGLVPPEAVKVMITVTGPESRKVAAY